MKYMLMICAGDDREATEPRMTIEDWVQRNDGRGVRLLGRGLRDPDTAATVRVRDGATLVTDGPFAETREFVAGFDIVECADLDEAIEVASDHPVAAFGAVEVRPLASDEVLPESAAAWGEAAPRDSWLLLPCVDGIPADDATEAQLQRDSVAWGERLAAAGVLVLGRALAPATAATTVRASGDQTLVTDGPFIEAKEFIAGFSVLRGIDRERAIALAAEHPIAMHHRVEVREFSQ